MPNIIVLVLVLIVTLVVALLAVLIIWILYDRSKIKRNYSHQRMSTVQDTFVSYIGSGRGEKSETKTPTTAVITITKSNNQRGLISSVRWPKLLSTVGHHHSHNHRSQSPNRSNSPGSPQPPPSPTTTTSRPIKVHQFSKYCILNGKDSNFGFGEEFELLNKVTKEMFHNKATVRSQMDKNRYMNIVPYESSIVRLDPVNDQDPNSSYINANFVPGINQDPEYIATQAPLRSTIEDFYRMLLQYRILLVVNLCKRENPSYFPKFTESPEMIEKVLSGVRTKVKLVEKDEHKDFVVNRIHFIQNNSIVHQLWQYHYNCWPDFGCPDSVRSLLIFIQAIRMKLKQLRLERSTGTTTTTTFPPIVVHCNAGVGRTGTLIAIDQLWQLLTKHLSTSQVVNNNSDNGHGLISTINKKLDKHHHQSPDTGTKWNSFLTRKPPAFTIDIYGMVYLLRQYRIQMVQTENQYAFIYECVSYILSNKLLLDEAKVPDEDRLMENDSTDGEPVTETDPLMIKELISEPEQIDIRF